VHKVLLLNHVKLLTALYKFGGKGKRDKTFYSVKHGYEENRLVGRSNPVWSRSGDIEKSILIFPWEKPSPWRRRATAKRQKKKGSENAKGSAGPQ